MEFFQVNLIVGNLPHAIGSPDAAIVNDDGVFPFEIAGKIEPSAIG